MAISAYPLHWPLGWPRTDPVDRVHSPFGRSSYHKPSESQASRGILAELGRMGVSPDDVVISTNIQLRLDGLPRSNQRTPDDTGVAVYWQGEDGDHVLACDRYSRVGCNLRAIEKTIEATRGITRWGCADLRRAFRGFVPLPESAGGEPWWQTLGLEGPTRDAEVLSKSFRKLALEHHPDRGGHPDAWHRLQQAVKQGLAYVEGAQ